MNKTYPASTQERVYDLDRDRRVDADEYRGAIKAATYEDGPTSYSHGVGNRPMAKGDAGCSSNSDPAPPPKLQRYAIDAADSVDALNDKLAYIRNLLFGDGNCPERCDPDRPKSAPDVLTSSLRTIGALGLAHKQADDILERPA